MRVIPYPEATQRLTRRKHDSYRMNGPTQLIDEYGLSELSDSADLDLEKISCDATILI